MPHRLRATLTAAHRVRPPPADPPPWLDLSHSRPQSVRDQMVRAQTAVELAVHEGLLGPEFERQLVVIGAGAAGITAALTALQRAVPTLLLHDGADATQYFRLQRNTPRFLDPTVYDWPAPHWVRPEWGEPAVLPWASGYANTIVGTDWMRKWAPASAAADRAGLLRIRHDCPLEAVSFVDETTIRLPDPRNPVRVVTEPAGLVVECVGPGRERVWPSGGNPSTAPSVGFRSFEYWDGADPVARPDFRLEGRRALVSGGGDGALQELLWLATGRTARELATFLRLDAFADRARALEDAYQRQYVWLSADGERFLERDHALLRRWHRDWKHLIEEMFLDDDLERRLDRRLGRVLPAPPTVQLVHGCEHFHYSFALNRVLVLLLDRFATRHFGVALVRPNLTVKACVGVDHSCISPATCFGRPHAVTLGSFAPGCAADGASDITVEADIVVLRHGIVSNQRRVSQPIPRQMVAYAPIG